MRKTIIILSVLACCTLSCVSTQTTTSSGQKTTDPMLAPMKLNGSWQLEEIPGARVAYTDKKPMISFDVSNNKFAGNTSCNNFSGLLVVYGSRINFNKSMAMTKMACPGDGESTFVESLKKVDSYTVNADNSLTLSAGDTVVMRLVKIIKQ